MENYWFINPDEVKNCIEFREKLSKDDNFIRLSPGTFLFKVEYLDEFKLKYPEFDPDLIEDFKERGDSALYESFLNYEFEINEDLNNYSSEAIAKKYCKITSTRNNPFCEDVNDMMNFMVEKILEMTEKKINEFKDVEDKFWEFYAYRIIIQFLRTVKKTK